MKSLFLKIFLSFWLVVGLFVALAILLTVATRPTRQISAIEALQPKLLSDAVSAYETGGADRLREYLRSIRESQHVRAVLFQDGKNLVGHPVPPWFTEVVNGQRHTIDTLLGRI